MEENSTALLLVQVTGDILGERAIMKWGLVEGYWFYFWLFQ